MWKNTFLYFILGNLALLGPEGRGGGGKLVTPIISISFWFSVSHFVRMKTVWNSFENTCLINRSKDKRYQEKVWKLNLQNPPQDYWTSGHLCIVLHVHNNIPIHVYNVISIQVPPVILQYIYFKWSSLYRWQRPIHNAVSLTSLFDQ